MMRSILLLVVLYGFGIPSTLSCKDYISVQGCRNEGMGFILYKVFNLICQYDLGYIDGLRINFGRAGCYYDPNYGDNWWDYYFEPVSLGSATKAKIVFASDDRSFPRHHRGKKDLQKKTCAAVRKYVHLKPYILEEIDSFVATHYEGAFVIGVHYRGTDKKKEAGRVSYEQMIREVKAKIEKLPRDTQDRYKLFVATDEQAFLELMLELFPGKVCFNPHVVRAVDEDSPLHFNRMDSPYQIGKNAIIDCLLLSRTSFLIKTVSNLSDCALTFNKYLESRIIYP